MMAQNRTASYRNVDSISLFNRWYLKLSLLNLISYLSRINVPANTNSYIESVRFLPSLLHELNLIQG